MSELVRIIDNEPLVSTLDIWEPLEVTHKAIIQLIRKYESEFSETRPIAFEMLMGKRGGVPGIEWKDNHPRRPDAFSIGITADVGDIAH